MNKKGFTVIELLASFSIAMTILIVLFNVVIMMKDNIADINTKSNMLVSKDNLAYNINKKFSEKDISSITICEDGVKCYLFTYSDDSTDKLVYNTDSITFNNYTFDITSDITVNEPTVTEHYDSMNSTTYDGYFIINIPIQFDKKDYSIKAIKYINTNSIMVDFTEYIYDNNNNKYTPVEYLESTGTQFINTGYFPSENSKIEIEYSLAKTPSNFQGIIYYAESENENASFGVSIYNSNFHNGIGNFTVKTPVETQEKQKVYISKDKIIINNAVYTNDGNFIYEKPPIDKGVTVFTSTWSNADYKYFISAKLYSLMLYTDSTLVRDYIPVIDASSRPCLFDKVEKLCYYNQGTGEFLYG